MFTTPQTLDDKLAQNEKKVLIEKSYPEQIDDLSFQLHDVCFQRFPVTPTQTLYKLAAEKLDVNQIPINTYDFSHLKNNH